MEIHAPHKPILTLKEAASHLVIVTVGILIALSLEGLLERQRHHALVREARANVTIELTGNKARLEKLHGELDGMKKNLERGLDVLNAYRAPAPPRRRRAVCVGAGGVVHNYDTPNSAPRADHRRDDRRVRAHGLRRSQTYAST